MENSKQKVHRGSKVTQLMMVDASNMADVVCQSFLLPIFILYTTYFFTSREVRFKTSLVPTRQCTVSRTAFDHCASMHCLYMTLHSKKKSAFRDLAFFSIPLLTFHDQSNQSQSIFFFFFCKVLETLHFLSWAP